MASRVVVFGFGEPLLAALDTFRRLSIAPLAVVVPGNRSGEPIEQTRDAAEQRGFRVLSQPPRARIAPFLETIAELRPDFLFVWSYTMLLPDGLLAVARRGGVNLHAGSLPDYRGGHVLNWALINGERETAVTLHVIDAGVDTGPVYAERRVAIEPDDDILSVHRKLIAAGSSLLYEWWPKIESGEAKAMPQDESRARYYRMRTADDGRVDWTQSSEQIRNLVRALVAPWPGARTFSGATQIVLRRVEDVAGDAPPPVPGTVVRNEPGDLQVATGSGILRLTAVEIDGRPADAPSLRSVGVRPGAVLH
ncbi:MAG TPA: methionyl-tRNA formyltransferase [Vicinamibacterales bacterium]|nr:methionyl-tRNA formyltransferase [Vicinamibacterales bacterium]